MYLFYFQRFCDDLTSINTTKLIKDFPGFNLTYNKTEKKETKIDKAAQSEIICSGTDNKIKPRKLNPNLRFVHVFTE